MRRITLSFLVGICVFFSASGRAADHTCPKLLTADGGDTVVDLDLKIEMDEYPLTAILNADPNQNLAYQHPSLVMNAFQRMKAALYFKPPTYISDTRYYPEKRRMFPVLSLGLPEIGRRRIVGLYRPIEAFGNYIDQGADGDGSASKAPTFWGPPGTGKTEFLMALLDIITHAQTYLPDYFLYTFEWRDLHKIPSLRPFVNSFGALLNGDPSGTPGDDYVYPIQSPLGDSPLVLLPPQLQDKVVAMAAPRVRELIKADPTPWTHLSPQDRFFRREVLKHYAKTLGHTPGINETVQILSKHVVIRRRVMGLNQTAPKINAEGGDVDWNGLTLMPNPFIMNLFGPNHPCSYWPGKILAAHGGPMLFDEYWRNRPELRDFLLELFENKVITRGGSQVYRVDIAAIVGSNKESIDEARSKTASRAQLDRAGKIPTFYSVVPHEVAKTMLLMKGEHRLRMQALGDPFPQAASSADAATPSEPVSQPVVSGNLNEMFPIPEANRPFQGPDHRYKLFVRSELEDVHISPHTLMFMAYVVAASRLVTDPRAAMEFGNYKVVGTQEFRDEMTRLKVLTRQLSVPAPMLKELDELSDYLEEGVHGISTRDAANTWLTQAIAEARKPGNGNCVTPIIAARIFKRLLQTKSIEFPDNATHVKWLHLMDMVSHSFLVPALEQDVFEAVGYDAGSIEEQYDEIFEEIKALQGNADATSYEHEGSTKFIDLKRLEEVKEYYLNEEKRPLAVDSILQVHSVPAGAPGVANRRHPGLMKAVRRYLAHHSTRTVTIQQLLQVANTNQGTEAARTRYRTIYQVMVHKLGYSPHGIKAALEVLAQAEINRQADKR